MVRPGRRATAVGATMVIVLGVATAAFAYWSGAGSGAGDAAAGTAQPLTVTAGTTTAQLHPGSQADVALVVSNPNPFTARVGSLTLDTSQGTGGYAVDGAHSGCGLSALTFTPQTNGGNGWYVPPKVGATDGSLSIDLSNALSLAANAGAACQGATVNVYLTASPDYQTTILGTAGLVSYWRLGTDPTAIDDFADTTGVILQSHSGRTAASWTKLGGLDAIVTGANRLRRGGADFSAYYASAIPLSADYAVVADVVAQSVISGDSIGVAGRLNPASGNYYAARYDTVDSSWNLVRYAAGTGTKLASLTGQALTIGQAYRMRLDLRGSTVALYVDDVATLSVTDGTYATAGKAGVRLGIEGANVPVTDTTGLHLDNFRVVPSTGSAVPDVVGGNVGTIAGAPLVNVAGGLSGDYNTAIRWGTSQGYASVPDANSLDLGDGPFTLEAWVRRLDTDTGRQDLLNKRTGAYQLGFLNNKLTLSAADVGDIAATTTTQGDTTAFHHYVATKTGSTVHLYVDGVDVTGTVTDHTLVDNANPLYLGARSNTTEFLNGVEDEVAVYHVVLDAATVRNHYHLGHGS